MSKRTPFYDNHCALGAKIIDFGGFDMPVSYAGIASEHIAVRTKAGLFDVSHMGEVLVKGPEALAFIQWITINDASKMSIGQAQYSAMCYEDGGIVDDLLIYRLAENEYMLVINASNIDKDWAWMNQHHHHDCTLENISDTTALLALQGPKSAEILAQLTDIDVASIPYYRFTTGSVAGIENVIVSATGYTGEKGFELYFEGTSHACDTLWNSLLEAGASFGIQPCGLGARDTLRLEKGYALYGNDISSETNPLEAGLGWITKFEASDFVGKEALQAIKVEGVSRRLKGFIIEEKRALPRSGYPLTDDSGMIVGHVTSGGQSITLEKGIGLGYVSKEALDAQKNLFVTIRKKSVSITITKPPFVA